MTFRLFLAALFVSVLAACGGGSSLSRMQPPTAERLPLPFRNVYREGYGIPQYSIDEIPSARSSDVKHSPIYTQTTHDLQQDKFFVGLEQTGSNIGALPVTGTRGDLQIRFGRLDDGVGRNRLVADLEEIASYRDNPDTSPIEGHYYGWVLSRWGQAPTVRIAAPASNFERKTVAETVRLINAALPEKYKMTLGSPLPPLPEDAEIPNGTIIVKFIRESDPEYTTDVGGDADNDYDFSSADNTSIKSSAIRVFGRRSGQDLSHILAHEMMHALGLGGHPLVGSESTLAYQAPYKSRPVWLLFPTDREVLRAMYSQETWAPYKVDPNNGEVHTPPEELLGTWASSSIHIHGNAAINVNLASMTGRADFTGFETWAVNTAPGAAGSGTTWLDGDLRYSIAVRGNTFRETGGDAGRLTGIFTGRAHEGAARNP